ncbi:MAG: response regulator [Pseudomonadota bacterium]
MLDDLNILIVEDEALIALDLSMILEDEGADIHGPCCTVDAAMGCTDNIDAAILDVDLRGETVFPIADRLQAAGTPFIFHTGRADMEELRGRYGADVSVVVKPASSGQVLASLTRAIGRR